MARMVSFVVAVAVSAVLLSGVHAHGSLRKPAGRQFCQPEGHNGVQEEAGNGARVRMAYDDKNGGMPGFCGDPFEVSSESREDPDYISHPCPAQETSQQGGIVSVEVAIKHNHAGSWEVAVCCDDVVTQECLDNNKLRHVQFGETMFYIQERGPLDPNDAEFEIYKQDWRLPPDVAGDKCMLVWTWWTAHRCHFWPCPEESCGPWYSIGKNPFKPDMLKPGSSWVNPVCDKYPKPGDYPQIFRNCADIKVEGGAGGAGGDAAATPETAERDGEETGDSGEDAEQSDGEPEEDGGDAEEEEDTEEDEEDEPQEDARVESTFADEDAKEEEMPSSLNSWLKYFTG